MDKETDKESYKTLAEQAALLEKGGSLRKASLAWRQAAGLAKKAANREWALIRADFCFRWRNRIAKQEGGSP